MHDALGCMTFDASMQHMTLAREIVMQVDDFAEATITSHQQVWKLHILPIDKFVLTANSLRAKFEIHGGLILRTLS